VLVHTGFHPAQPLLWLEAALEFPNVNVILAHMGGGVSKDAFLVAERASNVYLETSAQATLFVGRALRQFGAERVVFGTEAPYNDPRVELARIEGLKLPPEDLNQI